MVTFGTKGEIDGPDRILHMLQHVPTIASIPMHLLLVGTMAGACYLYNPNNL